MLPPNITKEELFKPEIDNRTYLLGKV